MNKKRIKGKHRLGFAEDLIENLPIGMMILDQDGKIIKLNIKQEKDSQIKRDKVLGKTFEEAFPRALDQGLRKPYFKLLRNGIPFDITIDKYMTEYSSRQMVSHIRGAPLSSGKRFVLLLEFEEELYHVKRLVEQRTDELHEYKIFLESLIDSSPNMVISTDLSGCILVFNKTAERTFGYLKEEVLGRRDLTFLCQPPPHGIEGHITQSSLSQEVLWLKKDQTAFPASLLISDIKNTSGEPIAKLHLLSDLTERKELEERLLMSEKLALYVGIDKIAPN